MFKFRRNGTIWWCYCGWESWVIWFIWQGLTLSTLHAVLLLIFMIATFWFAILELGRRRNVRLLLLTLLSERKNLLLLFWEVSPPISVRLFCFVLIFPSCLWVCLRIWELDSCWDFLCLVGKFWYSSCCLLFRVLFTFPQTLQFLVYIIDIFKYG